MAEKKENRRVRMTKRLMKEALLDLMEQQDLVTISVTAICETADVHRSTFYKYYTNPADLLHEIEQDFLNRIPSPPQILNQTNEKSLLASTTEFFDFVKESRKAVRVLFSESSENSFSARLVEHLCSGYVPVEEDADELTARFARLYIANGTVGMMREWVNEDFPISSQKIAEMMYYLSKKISQY